MRAPLAALLAVPLRPVAVVTAWFYVPCWLPIAPGFAAVGIRTAWGGVGECSFEGYGDLDTVDFIGQIGRELRWGIH